MSTLSSLAISLLTSVLLSLPFVAPSLGASMGPLPLALPALVAALGVIVTLVGVARKTVAAEGPDPMWALPVAAGLSTVPLLAMWSSASTNGIVVGGLLPFSDAGDYLQGAQRLLALGSLDGWNSRRPLNAALLAVRLWLGDHDLQRALALQSALFAASVTLAARALARDLGAVASYALLGGVSVFAAIFLATTMSESLGLTLGCLALATLWHAARSRSDAHLAGGMAILTIGLQARAGPFVLLPSLLVWAWLDGRDARWRRAGVSALGVAVGFAFNAALLRVHHGVAGGAQSNFSYTLYGLATGGLGWERAAHDFPAIVAMSEADSARFVYARAWALMAQHPLLFVKGLIANVGAVAATLGTPLLEGHPFGQWCALAVIVAGMLLVARAALRRRPDDAALRMVYAAAVGLAGSVPVIYIDGRERVFAAGFPLGIASIVATLAALRPARAMASIEDARLDARAPLAMAAALFAAALLVPRASISTPPIARCAAGEVPVAVWAPRRTPRLDLVEGAGAPTLPTMPRATLRRGVAHDPNLGDNNLGAPLTDAPAGTSLYAAFDLVSKRLEYWELPTAFGHGAVVSGCARRASGSSHSLYVVTPR